MAAGPDAARGLNAHEMTILPVRPFGFRFIGVLSQVGAKKLRGRGSVRSLVVALLAVVVLAVPAVVLADGRVALVVGNSTYAHIGVSDRTA